MLLTDVAAELAGLDTDLGWETRYLSDSVNAERVQFDSRQVRSGDLFACVPGQTVDGHDYADQAVAAGASALLVDRWLDAEAPQIRVHDVREAMGWVASILAGQPANDLMVVGVTGTNGKTTTTHLISSIYNHAGLRAEVLGTLSSPLTTLEAPRLQCRLRSFSESAVDLVAMEVSSHALVQHRVTGVRFAAGVFTNLSPDHLDYHGDMDSYFEAKAQLFRTERVGIAVINVGDAYGAALADRVEVPTVTYSTDQLEDVRMSLIGSSFVWRGRQVEISLPGIFNIENALSAAECCRALGLDDSQITTGLAAAEQVPGRFEVVSGPGSGSATVIVDYSHTPDGLRQVLRSVRQIDPEATLCVVFGAGGDRDRDKRPAMGQVASGIADHVILTSDNPRSEDPRKIIDDIAVGVEGETFVEIEPDRRRAIALALAAHGSDEVIVVAGKGHETTQTIGDVQTEFDDREVVRELVGGGAS